MSDAGIVIVGAGEAGVAACNGLRVRGFQGKITLIGAEARAPYERPPLSKSVLLDASASDPPPPTTLPEAHRRAINVRLISGKRARKIDRNRHLIEFHDGDAIGYDRLLFATGAHPRRLEVDGSAVGSVLYLRTFEDALALRARLRPGKTLGIVGGGLIGLEVAAAAVSRGTRVVLFERGERLLGRTVPEAISREVQRQHQAAGVEVHVATGVRSIGGNGEVLSLVADGQRFMCDTILAGIGALPETGLAADCGLEVENGIRVDETLRTGDEDIFAAGDCCSFPHPLYTGRRLRLEAWRNAQDQGLHVAGSLLGDKTPYTALPWFWSDQYDRLLRISGLIEEGTSQVTREAGAGSHIVFHLAADGRLVAASGFGEPATIAREVSACETLIAGRLRPCRAWMMSDKVGASPKDRSR